LQHKHKRPYLRELAFKKYSDSKPFVLLTGLNFHTKEPIRLSALFTGPTFDIPTIGKYKKTKKEGYLASLSGKECYDWRHRINQ